MRSRLLLLLAVFSLSASLLLLPSPQARTQERSDAASAVAANYHALVIGNNDYKALSRLKTAEADARAVASLLRESYGFETRLLLNATRQQIVSALFAYRQTLGPDANLLVYYAGHGINDEQADKAYWLPVDATRDDDSNWISADDITTRIRAIPARHVLVISDSCYSGTLTRGLGEALPPPNAREQFLRRMAAGRSRTLMASGGDEPVADGGGGGKHSVFANALLRGLRDTDKVKFTATELFRNYVQEPVAGRAQQTPEYNPLRNSGHEGGDFVFVRVKTDGRAVKAPMPAPAGSADAAAIEISFWESIKASTDAEDFKAYLDAYPTGRFAALAHNSLRRLGAAAKAAPPASETLSREKPNTCSAVRVSCPDSVAEGDHATFTADVSGGDAGVTPTFNWTVSAGTISSGQGTSMIKVETVGTGGQTITATVDVGGYARECATSSSCTISVTKKGAPAVKFGEYATADLSANKAQLDKWVLALQQDPTAQGYLIAYGGRASQPGDAQRAADNATDYTMQVRKLDGARTLSGVGGYREQPTVELWIAPAGGTPPMATPTVDPKDVKPAPANTPARPAAKKS